MPLKKEYSISTHQINQRKKTKRSWVQRRVPIILISGKKREEGGRRAIVLDTDSLGRE